MKITKLLLSIFILILTSGCCCHCQMLRINQPTVKDVYYQDYYDTPPLNSQNLNSPSYCNVF